MAGVLPAVWWTRVLRPAHIFIVHIHNRSSSVLIVYAIISKKSINYTDISGSVWAKGKKHRAYLAVYKTAYNNAKDIYTWTSSMTGYRASNIFPNDAVFAHKGSSLINDEVIIYREEQLTIQYLIELQI